MDREQEVLERVLTQYASNYINISETEQEKAKTDKMAKDVIGICGSNNVKYWDFYEDKKKELGGDLNGME